MLIPGILLIIAGIVLKANTAWFAGAATVGSFCFAAGVILLVLLVVLWILGILAAIGTAASSPSKRRSRSRRGF
jgi:hypothetical protein